MARTDYPMIEALESRIAPAGITAKLVGGSLFISGDIEDNEVTFNQINAHTFLISSSTGGIELYLPGSTDPVSAPSITFTGFKGNIVANLGGGNDSITIGQLFTGKNLTIDNGAGNNTVFLGFLQLAGNLTIKGGDGNDVVGANVLTAKSVNAKLGGGDNRFEIQSGTIGGALTVNAGDGNDMVGANLLTAKSVNAKLGGGDDLFGIQSGTIGGALSVNAGNGANQVQLGSSSSSFEVRGQLSIIHGNDALEDLTVIGGTNVKLGSVLIQNGAANSTTNISASLLESGPIRVLNGSGNDTVTIGGIFVNVKSVFVQGGEGNNALQITAPYLNISGDVLFNAGSGNDAAIIAGGGTIGGNVSLNLGSSSSGQMAQIGSGPAPLNIAKALTVKASADSNTVSNAITLGNVAVNGNAKFDITKGLTQLSINASSIRGSFNANLGNGNDSVIIEDSVFDGLFTLQTNDGLDTVVIETGGLFESRFNKAVKISLGAGNDSLVVGNGTPTSRAVFASKVTFDGGAGANTAVTDNGNIYPNTQPKLINFSVGDL